MRYLLFLVIVISLNAQNPVPGGGSGGGTGGSSTNLIAGTGIILSTVGSNTTISIDPSFGSGSWSGLSAPTADLTLAMAGFNSTWNTATVNTFSYINTTAATSGTQQHSPILKWCGAIWDGSASQSNCLTLQDLSVGATPIIKFLVTATNANNSQFQFPTNSTVTGGIASFVTLEAPRLVLDTSAQTCTSGNAGLFNYVQGNSSTKDIVQVCAHDASNVYAFRTIY